MHEQVTNIQLLSESDKSILHQAMEEFWARRDFSHVRKMSIFSDKYESREHGEYTTEHYTGDVDYYGRTLFTLAPLFLDSDYKIAPSSNGSLSMPHSFIECIDYYLENIDRIRRDPTVPSLWLSSLVAAQTWFPSYGHLHDELYILEDFTSKHLPKAPCLLDYHVNNDFIKNIPTSQNYIEMDRMILSAPSVNMHMRPRRVARISELTSIRNTIADPCFHSFPLPLSNQLIRESVNAIKSHYRHHPETGETIFISRRGGARSHRLFANIGEVESRLCEMGATIVYPEDLSFKEMIFVVSGAARIVLTWGSAITNLAYARFGASVVILRSNSYKGEQLSMFEKILKARSLSVTVVNSDSSDLVNLSSLLDSLSSQHCSA